MNLKSIILPVVFCAFGLQSQAQLEVRIDNRTLEICLNDVVGLTSTIVSGKPTSYKWSSNVGTFNTASDSQTTSTLSSSGFIYLKTEDGTNTFLDSVWVKVNARPTVKMPAPLDFCCGAGLVDLRLYEDSNAKGGVWSCKKNPYYVSNGYEFDLDLACWANNTSKHYISYQFTDSTTGCVKNDSFIITVNALPAVKLQDGYFCQDRQVINLKEDKIIRIPGNPSVGSQAWNCIDCKTYNWSKILKDIGSGFQNFILQIDEKNFPLGSKSSDSIEIELVYKSHFGCVNRDTATIVVTKFPQNIKFSGFPELCWDQGLVDLKQLSNVTPNDGFWSAYDTIPGTYRKASDLNSALKAGPLQGDTLNTMATPQPVYPNPYKYYMRYYYNRGGCYALRDTALTINPLPEPKIFHDNLNQVTSTPPYLFCETADEIQLSASPSGGTWSSNQPRAISGNSFRPAKSPVFLPFYIKYDFVSIKGCPGADSVQVQIEGMPDVKISVQDTLLFADIPITVTVLATIKNTSNITWTALTGSVNDIHALTVQYTLLPNKDSCTDNYLYVQTNPKNACPFDDDMLKLKLCPLKLIPANLTNIENLNSPKIYPNPCNGIFHIEQAAGFEFQLLDMMGRKMPLQSFGNHAFESHAKGAFILEGTNSSSGRQIYQRIIFY